MKGRGNFKEVILSDEFVSRPKTVSHSSMQERMMTSSLSTAIVMMSSCALVQCHTIKLEVLSSH